MRAQDLPVRLDAPDAVHKMRVATRRLRSALTTFKPLFDADVVRPLRGELKWLAGELGAARDAEVMRDRVRTAVEAESDGRRARPGRRGRRRRSWARPTARAHDRVLAELDGERYHRLLAGLDGLVTVSAVDRSAPRLPAGKALPRLVARSYAGGPQPRRGRRRHSRPAPSGRSCCTTPARPPSAARYAGESVSRVFGDDATAFAQAMEAVQEALGEHQDSVLTRERLRDLALHTSSTAAAFLYGRLHALEEARAEQSQQHFDDAWKAAGRKSLHRWLR